MKKEHIYLLLGVLSLSLSACTTYPKINNADLKSEMRSGPVCLNSDLSILSGISADSHAASLTVGSITA